MLFVSYALLHLPIQLLQLPDEILADLRVLILHGHHLLLMKLPTGLLCLEQLIQEPTESLLIDLQNMIDDLLFCL